MTDRVGRQEHWSQVQKIPTPHPNVLESVGGWNSTSAESWRSWHGVVMTKAQELVPEM